MIWTMDSLRTKPEKNNEMYCMMTIFGTLQIVSSQGGGVSPKDPLTSSCPAS